MIESRNSPRAQPTLIGFQRKTTITAALSVANSANPVAGMTNRRKQDGKQDELKESGSLVDHLTSQIQSSSSQQLSNLVNGSTSPQLFLDALSPNSPSKARPLALLSLSRLVAESASLSTHPSSILSIFGPFLQKSLQSKDQDDTIPSLSEKIGITSLLKSLAALDPQSTTCLLSEPKAATLQEVSADEDPVNHESFGFLSKLLFISASFDEKTDQEKLLLINVFNFSLAELVSTVSSSSSTRKVLLQSDSPNSKSKLQEFIQFQTRDKKAEPDSVAEIKRGKSILLHLASLKIKRGSGGTDSGLPQPEPKSQTDLEKQTQRRQDQINNETLFRLSREEILDFSKKNLNSRSSVLSEEFQSDIARTSLLASLEALSHLTLLKRSMREKVANDAVLLKSMKAISGIKSRSKVFPSRSESESQSNPTKSSQSSYDLDSRLTSQIKFSDSTDSAIQYGIVSLISSLVSYSHSKPGAENSKEQAQMRKLKEMANGQSKKDGKSDEEEESEEDPNPIVDKRSTLLVEAGIVETLVGILFTPDPKGKTSINPSKAIRKELARALYGLCVKQDRISRGKIIQAGGARGLLSLGSLALSEYDQSFEKDGDGNSQKQETNLDLTACSALSLLLISHPPHMALGAQSSINAALPLMTALYLHPTATDLQRFEAALALTNLSSIDESSATKVSNSKAPKIRKAKGFLDGEGTEEIKEMTIGNSLEALILLENNLMLRRANVELLCNLVAGDEGLNRLWSGETEEEEASKLGKERGESNQPFKVRDQSRARTRIHALVAFCSPNSSTSTQLNEKENHNNVSIPLRLAASGALASLSESPVACSHLLALGPRTLNHIVRLIDFTVPSDLSGFSWEDQKPEPKIKEITESEGQEGSEPEGSERKKKQGVEEAEQDLTDEEEIELHRKELDSWPSGFDHASSQFNLRGLAILSSLSSYLSWRSSHSSSTSNSNSKENLSKQGLSLEKEKEIFIRSGFERSLRNLVRNGLLELQSKGKIESKESSKSVAGKDQLRDQDEAMKRQCIKIGMECLKKLKDLGISG